MKPIDLNFSSNPFRNNTPYYLGYALGALVLVAFTTFNAWAYFAYSQSRAELETDHQAKKVRLEALLHDAARTQEQIKEKNIDALNARAVFTNSLLEKRRFSWTDLLNSLEEVQPYQVRLLSLIPRIQEKGILIEARAVAKDLRAFWNFQQNLQNHPKFRRVYPGGYVRNSDAGEYIFNLSFNYFPEGAPPDVQGLTPELAGITQAPGAGAGSAPLDLEEEDAPAVEEAPPNGKPPKGPHNKTVPPVRADSGQQATPPPAPSAQAEPRPPRTNPPVANGTDAPRVPFDGGSGRGAAAERDLPPELRTTTAGVVPTTDPTVDGTSSVAPKPGRWTGRGKQPGTNGKPADKKPPEVPTFPIPGRPVPEPGEEDHR